MRFLYVLVLALISASAVSSVDIPSTVSSLSSHFHLNSNYLQEGCYTGKDHSQLCLSYNSDAPKTDPVVYFTLSAANNNASCSWSGMDSYDSKGKEVLYYDHTSPCVFGIQKKGTTLVTNDVHDKCAHYHCNGQLASFDDTFDIKTLKPFSLAAKKSFLASPQYAAAHAEYIKTPFTHTHGRWTVPSHSVAHGKYFSHLHMASKTNEIHPTSDIFFEFNLRGSTGKFCRGTGFADYDPNTATFSHKDEASNCNLSWTVDHLRKNVQFEDENHNCAAKMCDGGHKITDFSLISHESMGEEIKELLEESDNYNTLVLGKPAPPPEHWNIVAPHKATKKTTTAAANAVEDDESAEESHSHSHGHRRSHKGASVHVEVDIQ